MKRSSSREVIKKLKAEGWYLDRIAGSHHHFKHPLKKGLVTIPHPRKTVHPRILKSIEKQSGVSFK